MNVEKIQSIMKKYQAKTSAPLGIGFRDMESKTEIMLQEDQLFPIASVFKIFVLIELFRMIERGEISMEQEIVLEEKDFAVGSGFLKNFRPGCSLPLYDYCYMMMSYSDNTATDIVMKIVTPERIRKDLLEPFGLEKTRVELLCNRLVTECYIVPAPKGETLPDGNLSYRLAPYFLCQENEDNRSTVRELMRCLTMLYEERFLTPSSTRQALDIMKLCALNQRIPKKLPKETVVAHKTGSLDRVCNDVGFVYSPKGTYAIILLYNGNLSSYEEYTNNDTGSPLLADLSREIYDAYMEEVKSN